MQVLLDLAPFIAVFDCFLGVAIRFAEWMLWIADCLFDDIKRLVHISTLVESENIALAFPCFGLPCFLSQWRQLPHVLGV